MLSSQAIVSNLQAKTGQVILRLADAIRILAITASSSLLK